jgi:hypothetical protein
MKDLLAQVRNGFQILYCFARSCVLEREMVRSKVFPKQNKKDVILIEAAFERNYIIEALRKPANRKKRLWRCPQANCFGVQMVKKVKMHTKQSTVCSLCRANTCTECALPWQWPSDNSKTHENLTCVEYGNKVIPSMKYDKLALQFNKKHNGKQCPSCNTLVEKMSGCDSMTCLSCGHGFCWQCLQSSSSPTYVLNREPLPCGHFRPH